MNDATDKIVDRIRKMLNLANDLGATEAERETALRMAYNLLAKYNLELADVQGKAQEEKRIDNENVCFGMPWVRTMSDAIAELFFCEYYFERRKVNATQIRHHFVGKESNAVTAAVIADWITKSILKECRTLYKHNLCTESREFATGAAQRLRERIREMKRQATTPQASGSKALVLADVYQLEKSANELFLRESGVVITYKTSRTKDAAGSDAFERGRAFGNTINLNRQVSQKPSGLLR